VRHIKSICGIRFGLLLLVAAALNSGCGGNRTLDRDSDPAAETARPAVDSLNSLSTPVASEIWLRSANSTTNTVVDYLTREQIDQAIDLTKQALALPRHPNRNDHYGWGHATMSLSTLLDGLVKAERWDELVELGHDSDAQVGNEYVESQRIRSLALAHWKKRQFAFRSQLLHKELSALSRSHNLRINEHQDWNEINSPKDQIKIDWPLVEASKKHIESSLAFIDKLEQTQSNADVAKLKEDCLKSELEVPGASQSATSDSEKSFDELKLFPPAPDFRLADASGNKFSLAETEGRGTLVVFYLGRTCFHCAMQLKEFAPRFKERTWNLNPWRQRRHSGTTYRRHQSIQREDSFHAFIRWRPASLPPVRSDR